MPVPDDHDRPLPSLDQLSAREREVLEELWQVGPSTVRALLARLRHRTPRLAYSTVKTFVHRLEGKGWLRRRADNVAHVFAAAWSLEEVAAREARRLVRRGHGSTLPVIRSLVETADLDAEEIRELETLVEGLGSDRRNAR